MCRQLFPSSRENSSKIMNFVSRTLGLKRVVVTGMGIICPVGNSVPQAWEAVRNGVSGIDRISRFDASGLSSQIAGEVKGYNPLDHFDRKEVRKFDPFIQFAILASNEAVADAGLADLPSRERVGVYVGSGIGGISTIEENQKVVLERGAGRVSPFFIPASIANLASGQISIAHGLKGPNMANCTACATSTHALGDSFRLIQRGDADVMLCGGAEYPITPLAVGGFAIMKALSTRNDEPKKASRPFDKDRDGFVVAEGAAVLVLESLEHALARGVHIYGEVVGYGFSGDAYHMTAPDPEADGACRSMRMALADAGLRPEEVAYINAHGTSTPFNDRLESLAIGKVFGEYAGKLKVSSTKSVTGHMLGATGGAEAIFTLKAIGERFVPPTMNYETPDEECPLDVTPNKGVSMDIPVALSNSFGFGGTNGTVVLRRFDGV